MSLSPLPCFCSYAFFASIFPCENKHHYFVEMEERGKRRKDGAWKKIISGFHRFHFKKYYQIQKLFFDLMCN